jgi:hypothetical protein
MHLPTKQDLIEIAPSLVSCINPQENVAMTLQFSKNQLPVLPFDFKSTHLL